jgi:hypothetical protein
MPGHLTSPSMVRVGKMQKKEKERKSLTLKPRITLTL